MNSTPMISPAHVSARLRYAILVVPVLLSLIAAGCVAAPTLYPLYDKTVSVSNDEIVGHWISIDKDKAKPGKQDCCWIVEKIGDTYTSQLDDADTKETWVSAIRLIKLGDAMFLDATGGDVSYSRMTKVSMPMLNTHAIGRIWIEKDSVRLMLLNENWLRDAAKNGESPLSFVEPDKQLVVTATTEQLQAFCRKYADNPKVFSEEFNFRRKK